MKANRLVLAGYGPLAAIVAGLLVVTLVVPVKERGAADVAFVPDDPAFAAEPAAPASVGTARTPGKVAVPGKTARTKKAAAGTPTTAAPARAGAAPAAAGVVPAASCAGGALQVKGSAYSPACVQFDGDNGGATSRGVTPTTIRVAIRENATSRDENEEADSDLEKKAEEAGIRSSPAERRRELDTLVEYFNSNYELYGRKVELVRYKGRGDGTAELAGGGQEGANADALKVAQELKAFADISALSQPYMDALVRQRVLSIGGLHLPASNYRAKAPYAWGQLIDCTTLLNSAVDLLAKRLPAGGNAERAGSAAMRSKPRKYGLLVPDDAVYSQCIKEARPKFAAAGISFAKEIRYALDFSKLQQESPNMAAQMKSAGVTTLVLVTDPLLPFFLTGAATQQDFYPEWFVTGTIGTDADVAGQFYDQDQWRNAIGQSYLTGFGGGRDSEARRAFASMGKGQPTALVDLTYQTLLMLFVGIQQAGPTLTPATFARGMFAYGTHTGEYGRWSFGPNDYTSTDDAREFYYDPRAISPFNSRPGRCVPVGRGTRYVGASWPAKSPGAPIPPAVAP